jgi:hypothetical protein
VAGGEREGVGIEREREHAGVIGPRPDHAALQGLDDEVRHGIGHYHGNAEVSAAGNDQQETAEERRGGDSAEVSGKAKGSIEPARSPAVGQREEPGPVQRVHPIDQLLQMSARVIVTEMTGRWVTYSRLESHDRATI